MNFNFMYYVYESCVFHLAAMFCLCFGCMAQIHYENCDNLLANIANYDKLIDYYALIYFKHMYNHVMIVFYCSNFEFFFRIRFGLLTMFTNFYFQHCSTNWNFIWFCNTIDCLCNSIDYFDTKQWIFRILPLIISVVR